MRSHSIISPPKLSLFFPDEIDVRTDDADARHGISATNNELCGLIEATPRSEDEHVKKN
jgi:hypothetical protein